MFAFIVVLSFVLFIYLRARPRRSLPLPPGPPGDPFIGHLRLVPADKQETLFYEWGKLYGDVMHLNFLGQSVIVLNSVKAAADLLDKRSVNYSDRPRFIVFEMMGWVAAITFIQYGKRFQRHRRMMHHYLTVQKCIGYQSIQTQEAHILLQSLISDNNGRDDFVRRYATAIIMRVVYGHKITSGDDPYIKVVQDAGYAIGNGGPPGSTPVDFFPFLQYLPSWFPGAYYAGFARDNKFAIDALLGLPFESMKKQMAKGEGQPSFLYNQLEKLNREGRNYPNTIEDIKGAAGTMYFGGSDTVKCQARAQEEIDAIIGNGRLPEFSDRASLPYVESILQETLRWNSAVPLGVPHRSLEDDVYNGMFIPKGSIVIPNTRGMTLDATVYTDPFKFKPTRYLPKPEGNAEPHPSGPFGFGRRICPGRHFADASLWIAIVSILATLDISKTVDSDGKEITPEVGFTSGITCHPHPFGAVLQPRNRATQELIAQADIWDT